MFRTDNLTLRVLEGDYSAVSAGEVAINDLLGSIKKELGVDHVQYFASSVVGIPRQVVIGTYPREWCQIYVDRGYVQRDPVLQHVLLKAGPCQWSTLSKLSEGEAEVMKESIPYIGKQGLTVPVGKHPLIAAISVTSNMEDREWILATPDILWKLTSIAQKLHALVVKEHEISAPNQRLTDVQKQCLRLIAVGTGVDRIASILDANSVTVQKHLDQAQKKLEAFNQSHMIARAVLLGEIAL